MKQKNKWLDQFIILLFVIGVFGIGASIGCRAFKTDPIIGCFVVSIELIILASILYAIKKYAELHHN